MRTDPNIAMAAKLSAWMQAGGELPAGKQFHTHGAVKSGLKCGGSLRGAPAGRGYFLDGTRNRITRTDWEERGAVVLMQNAGDLVECLDIAGTVEKLQDGTIRRTPYGIALEGRETYDTRPNDKPTGKHTIRNVCIGDCEAGIAYLPGFTDEKGNWVDNESHADESEFDRVQIVNCPVGVLSLNQQAIDHEYNIQFAGPSGTVFQLDRGGSIRKARVSINSPDCTLFQCRDYNPWTANLEADIYRDNFGNGPGQRLTLLDLVGPPDTYKYWSVKITGVINWEWWKMPDLNFDDLVRLNGHPGDAIFIDKNMRGLPTPWVEKWRVQGNWLQMVPK